MPRPYGQLRTPPARNADNIGDVPDPAVRLLQLLGLLQRRLTWGGPDLAARLGVDPRTLRRDVERLRSLGYDVVGESGPGGGYRLGGGADVPPLLFDDEEAMAIAVVLGVSAGAAVPGIEHGALAALAKLDRLLPPRLRNQLNALRSATVSLISPGNVARGEAIPPDRLTRLAQACESHQSVTFAYRAYDGHDTDRRVEPHRLVATDRRWYLVAYDLDRQDWRTFRVDRAGSVTIPGHTFVPRPLADPGRMVAEAITTSQYVYRAVVRVKAPAGEVARMVYPQTGMVEADGQESVVSLGADELNWIAGYFVQLGLDFEVIEPPELRAHCAALGQQLRAAHSPPSPAAR
jgi:predicted DNA-binding transcriptional regulator YafY